MTDQVSHSDLLRLTVEVITAHASHNTFPVENLSQAIRDVYAALAGAKTEATSSLPAATAEITQAPVHAETKPLVPAVPIKSSVFHDHIVCLEDGKKLKLLKGHLQAAHGLTPGAYRQKWSLPETYPIVAPDYAALRSTTAKKLGFGRKRKVAAPEVAVRRIPEGVSAKKRGRPRRG